MVRGHSNRTLEEAVSVRFGLGGTFSDSWVYAVTVYEGGVIRDDEIDVIEKFTGKEIIEIE
ncbi:hypothetical protein CMI45_00975 [Candidatus Pacearchaeota archaeon]|nr:hypothetical protein [Candidatus Pacearchaeota archaeon]